MFQLKGKTVERATKVMDVNVDAIRDLYVEMYGKNPKAEAAKRAATKAANPNPNPDPDPNPT